MILKLLFFGGEVDIIVASCLYDVDIPKQNTMIPKETNMILYEIIMFAWLF